MKNLILIILFFLSSCAGVSKSYSDENGKDVFEASCNGLVRSMGDCYSLANKECKGKKIEVINKHEQHLISGGVARSLLFSCQ